MVLVGIKTSGQEKTQPKVWETGYVKTRQFVVDAMLDFVGFDPIGISHGKKLLDPGCGDGTFFLSALNRVLLHDRFTEDWLSDSSFLAVDLDPQWISFCRQQVKQKLSYRGLSQEKAASYARAWVRQEDFLLSKHSEKFDYIVGNPPYIRKESIDPQWIESYQSELPTLKGRFDTYVGFFEKALTLLADDGKMSFICPDRFIKNAYGKELRKYIASNATIESITDVPLNAFEENVAAYTKIFTLNKARRSLNTKIQFLGENGKISQRHRSKISNDGSSWFLRPSQEVEMLESIIAASHSVSDVAGVHVKIGVATGADQIFIIHPDTCDIEPEVLIPIALPKHLKNSKLSWDGLHVINPFEEDGSLKDLERYPRLKRYLLQNKARLQTRHVAKKSQGNWYRTIDRIWPAFTKKAKLLIRDISVGVTPLYDPGKFYPHHNFYFILSDELSLKAIGALLSSSINQYVMQMHSVKMRGDYIRNQAQNLRQLRLPKNLSLKTIKDLEVAFEKGDVKSMNEATYHAFGLSRKHAKLLESHLLQTPQ